MTPLLRPLVCLLPLVLAGCGARTPVLDGYTGPDVIESSESSGAAGSPDVGSAGSAGAAPGYWVDLCYHVDQVPSDQCLAIGNPSLLPVLECPAGTPISDGPVLDINVSTGLQRCCYRVAGGVCVDG